MLFKKNKAAPSTDEPPVDYVREGLLLGHLVKYNLYLLSKAVIFAALIKTEEFSDSDDAARETNRVIGELDLDTKQRT